MPFGGCALEFRVWISLPETLPKSTWHLQWPPLSTKHPSTSLSLPCRLLGLTTLGGSLCPGRYLTFSFCVLMISVSFLPPTSSSNTHMVTRGSKRASWAALPPTILAMAEPLAGGGAQKVEEWGRAGGIVAREGQCSISGYHSSPPGYLLTTFLVTPTCDSVSLMRLSLPHTWMLEKGASCLISPLPQTQAAF